VIDAARLVRLFATRLETLPAEAVSAAAVTAILREIQQEEKLPGPVSLFSPLRLLLTASKIGMGVADIVAVLGRDRSLQRLARATELQQ
jgi:glutamyl/glutaminyl-tRNA synthetase